MNATNRRPNVADVELRMADFKERLACRTFAYSNAAAHAWESGTVHGVEMLVRDNIRGQYCPGPNF